MKQVNKGWKVFRAFSSQFDKKSLVVRRRSFKFINDLSYQVIYFHELKMNFEDIMEKYEWK